MLAGQQPLGFTGNVPDPKAESRAKAALLAQFDRLKNRANRQIEAVEMARTMMERGLQLPDVAHALGLSPVVPRASKPLNPWRLRPGSNMDIVAGMLEAAGTKGVTEDEMVAELRRRGRLKTATEPRRAVHWTVTELRRRTSFLENERVVKARAGTATDVSTSGAGLQHGTTERSRLDLLHVILYNVGPC